MQLPTKNHPFSFDLSRQTAVSSVQSRRFWLRIWSGPRGTKRPARYPQAGRLRQVPNARNNWATKNDLVLGPFEIFLARFWENWRDVLPNQKNLKKCGGPNFFGPAFCCFFSFLFPFRHRLTWFSKLTLCWPLSRACPLAAKHRNRDKRSSPASADIPHFHPLPNHAASSFFDILVLTVFMDLHPLHVVTPVGDRPAK